MSGVHYVFSTKALRFRENRVDPIEDLLPADSVENDEDDGGGLGGRDG